MTTRYFAFGCSYVNSHWGTIADLIGANFDQYYNLGNPGGCNTFSCSRFLEIDNIFKYNSETDFITIGVTGYSRFSIADKDENLWITCGDTLHAPNPGHPEKARLFATNLDSFQWGVYRSWCAIKSMKDILTAKNIKHIIYPSLDMLMFQKELNLDSRTVKMAEEILEMCDIKESVDEFVLFNCSRRGERYDDGFYDDHPNQSHYYQYLKKHFPQFDNDKTKQRFDFLESLWDRTSYNSHFLNFTKNFVRIHRQSTSNLLWHP